MSFESAEHGAALANVGPRQHFSQYDTLKGDIVDWGGGGGGTYFMGCAYQLKVSK